MPETSTPESALVPFVGALEMNNGAAFTSATSLWIPPATTFEQWLDLRPRMEYALKGIKWWVGDWLNAGEDRYEGWAQAVPELHWEKQTLLNMCSVCKQIPAAERRAALSFSHHAAVAALAPKLRERFLDLAQKEKWSVSLLRLEVAKLKAHVEEKTSGSDQAPPDDFLPLDIPVEWQQLASVATENLDREDVHSLWVALGVDLGETEEVVSNTPTGEAALAEADSVAEGEFADTMGAGAPLDEADEFLRFADDYVPPGEIPPPPFDCYDGPPE